MRRLLKPVRLLLLVPAFAAWGQSAPSDEPLKALPYAPSLDLTSMDTGTDACADFYQFSCGGWMRRNPIPADEAGWSVYDKLQDDNLRFLWGLLIDAAQPQPDRSVAAQKAGDYFAACIAPEADGPGAAALAGPAQDIAQLASVNGMAPLIASLHALGADGALFHLGAEQDAADSSRMLATFDVGGLGLPDREQYLQQDPRSVALRLAYRRHVARTLILAGDPPRAAEAAAHTVLAIETALARASLSGERRRDPHSVHHRMSLRALQRLAPGFDWQAYLSASGAPKAEPINVTQPRFFRALGRLLASRPVADWRNYLRWHLWQSQSPYLSTPFAQAHFDFYSKTLQGVEALSPRWKRCVQWVDRDVGEALGQLFVQRSFSPATKERALEMTRRIQAEMRSRIEGLPWMSRSTKTAALAKLNTMVNKVGYPERWRDYSGLVLKRDDFLGNVQRSATFERQRQLAKIGQPVDHSEWDMTPATVNAYYDAQMNDINFPAGVLQPPLFDPSLDDAPNYGNTGSTIGHELTHGFDDEGRQFDAQGNLRDWWTKKDAAAFERRASCVADQYSHYTVVDRIKINGRLTLGEDLADLGGTLLAYAAWKAATAGQALSPRDGFTPDQRFFIGMAQWACSNDRPETLRLRALTDAHSPDRYRINGVVSNMPEFARAFSCRAGQAMVRQVPCQVW